MRVVHTSKSPFEIFLLVASVLSGVIGLVSPDRSSSAVSHLLPLWGQYIWYAGLLASGLLTTAGALTDRLWSLFAEGGGLLMLGTLCCIYTFSIVVIAGATATFAGLFVLGFSAACFARTRQISRDIRRVIKDDSL